MKVAVLGAGAWGTALAIALVHRGPVALWTRDAAQARLLQRGRANPRYLPGATLPAAVAPTASFERALRGADLALIATPTAGLRGTAHAVAAARPGLPLVWACKGFEAGSARLPHQVVAEELPGDTRRAALSGPSFAAEVAAGLPTALTLASADAAFARDTARALHGSRLRVYSATDVVGVEVGGAVKNVIAIAAGICDGLGLGHNARAALLTRGLAEITRLGRALGGHGDTFLGLAGAGDLILTATGDLSRNRRVGLALAAGRSLAEILATLGHVSEGVLTAPEVLRLAASVKVEMPITKAVNDVLHAGVPARQAVASLLARAPKAEFYG